MKFIIEVDLFCIELVKLTSFLSTLSGISNVSLLLNRDSEGGMTGARFSSLSKLLNKYSFSCLELSSSPRIGLSGSSSCKMSSW